MIHFPAEWHEQDAIMLTWPHAETDWADQLDAVTQVYVEIGKAVLTHQDLMISCEDPIALQKAKDQLQKTADAHQHTLYCYEVPADDTWARDHGPICVYKNGKTRLLDFTFNAWGDKYGSSKDDQITSRLNASGAFPGATHEEIDFVLEGGSIETDGRGTLLTTTTCLLSETRNGDLSQREIEKKLAEHLGAERVLWLQNGYLSGDDTDAHIDTLARFCDEETICYVKCDQREDEHFEALNRMEAELRDFRTDDNQPYTLVPLPMPDPIYDGDKRLPATYANFLITNQAVLLPVYQQSHDAEAIQRISQCFPDKKVMPIDCRPLIKQHGSLHCVTMQLPKGVFS